MKTITFRPLILIGFIVWIILIIPTMISIVLHNYDFVIGWIIGAMYMIVFILLIKYGEK